MRSSVGVHSYCVERCELLLGFLGEAWCRIGRTRIEQGVCEDMWLAIQQAAPTRALCPITSNQTNTRTRAVIFCICVCLFISSQHQAVRAIGRCAVSLENAAQRCIAVLLELIQTKVNYVVQEAVIVIKVGW